MPRMGTPNPVQRITEEEYLRMERAADFKSQYFDGEVFALSGGTRWHNLISLNLGAELRQLLKGSGCVAFESNLRVKAEATGLCTYPDASVACGEQRFVDNEMDTLLNPVLVAEVLSDSTEAFDRGKKFEHYRQIPSLLEYILVSQHEPLVELFSRRVSGEWVLSEAAGMENSLYIPSLKITLSLAEIFANVKFEPRPLPEAKKP